MRRLIGTLVVLVLALLVLKFAAFSGASFSARSQNPANTFTSGRVVITNDLIGTYVVDATNLRPGQTQQGTVTLTSTSSFPVALTLAGGALTVTPSGSTIATVLRLTVEDVTSGTPVAPAIYDGTLAGLGNVAVTPALAVGGKRALRFTVAFPSTASEPQKLQGHGATRSVTITAVPQ